MASDLRTSARAYGRERSGLRCGLLHRNLSPSLPTGRSYVMAEHKTCEATPLRPLTMPVLIEFETRFLVATAVGSIRPLAAADTARRR